jgi:HxlR-like helix-turn-helix
MISRTVFPVVPPRVDYALTDLGSSLLGLMRALETWAEAHISDVARARAAYDLRAATAAGTPGRRRSSRPTSSRPRSRLTPAGDLIEVAVPAVPGRAAVASRNLAALLAAVTLARRSELRLHAFP